jgi:hypothetical protein
MTVVPTQGKPFEPAPAYYTAVAVLTWPGQSLRTTGTHSNR